MPTIKLDRTTPRTDADWHESSAAFTCPHCRKVFIVTSLPGEQVTTRMCPCGKSIAQIKGATRASLDY